MEEVVASKLRAGHFDIGRAAAAGNIVVVGVGSNSEEIEGAVMLPVDLVQSRLVAGKGQSLPG